MTNKELALIIRTELKENGFDNKKVSVRVKDAGYETAVDVTVKDVYSDIEKVKLICNKYSHVDYCEVSGELLAGCNTFVHVAYDERQWEALADLTMEECKEIADSFYLTAELNDIKEIAKNESNVLYIAKTRFGMELRTIGKDNISYVFGRAKDMAYLMAKWNVLGKIA